MKDEKVAQGVRLIKVLKGMREQAIQKSKGIEEKGTIIENNMIQMFTNETIKKLTPNTIRKSKDEQGFELGE